MKINNYKCSLAVFVINLLVLVLVVFGIKNREMDKFSMEITTEESVVPVSSNIIDLQNKIAVNRENKLRDLNISPKEIVQEDTITTQTVVTPVAPVAPVVKKKADKKTKTS